jgi:hypothetical protein
VPATPGLPRPPPPGLRQRKSRADPFPKAFAGQGSPPLLPPVFPALRGANPDKAQPRLSRRPTNAGSDHLSNPMSPTRMAPPWPPPPRSDFRGYERQPGTLARPRFNGDQLASESSPGFRRMGPPDRAGRGMNDPRQTFPSRRQKTGPFCRTPSGRRLPAPQSPPETAAFLIPLRLVQGVL